MSRNARAVLLTVVLSLAWEGVCWGGAAVLRAHGPSPMTGNYREATQMLANWGGFLGVAAINLLTLRWANRGAAGGAGESGRSGQ